jgi:hypothetical protein
MVDLQKLTDSELLQGIEDNADAISAVAETVRLSDRIGPTEVVAKEQYRRANIRMLVNLCRERDAYVAELERRYPPSQSK